MDEPPELKRRVREVLRQPSEAGKLTISRAVAVLIYPDRCPLAGTPNRRPCSHLAVHPLGMLTG